ncbi:hypothetical protein EVAR_17738_1 [Eumeta japonica]|uniref:Uncharacterized protein n=1 Tax=Eumeta variegata TaxID=151549 RepID=A0A4C1TT96_EUMVA|nr:hypothetical protein EVAR_17738_1 [Eumeta japonica]
MRLAVPPANRFKYSKDVTVSISHAMFLILFLKHILANSTGRFSISTRSCPFSHVDTTRRSGLFQTAFKIGNAGTAITEQHNQRKNIPISSVWTEFGILLESQTICEGKWNVILDASQTTMGLFAVAIGRGARPGTLMGKTELRLVSF